MTAKTIFEPLLADPGAVRALGPGLYTALADDAGAAPYDRKAWYYDATVGRSLYHRIFWGTSASSYRRFAHHALEAARDECFAEAACGTLVFTSGLYRDFRGTFALLMDRSLRMLRRGMRRLAAQDGTLPDGVALLHADVAATPIRSGAFGSILSLNLLHVPCAADAILAEFARLLIPGRGRLFVSALVRSGRWSDAYHKALHRAGELAAPVGLDELCARVAGGWGVVESARTEGNMSFLVVRHAG